MSKCKEGGGRDGWGIDAYRTRMHVVVMDVLYGCRCSLSASMRWHMPKEHGHDHDQLQTANCRLQERMKQRQAKAKPSQAKGGCCVGLGPSFTCSCFGVCLPGEFCVGPHLAGCSKFGFNSDSDSGAVTNANRKQKQKKLATKQKWVGSVKQRC